MSIESIIKDMLSQLLAVNRSLILSNERQTSGQISRFLQMFDVQQYLTSLRSLTLLEPKLEQAKQILSSPLPSLITLNLTSSTIAYKVTGDICKMVLCGLLSLKKCSLVFNDRVDIDSLDQTLDNMKYFTCKKVTWEDLVNKLAKHLSHIHYLDVEIIPSNISVVLTTTEQSIPTLIPNLLCLKLSITKTTYDEIQFLLKGLPHLKQLTLKKRPHTSNDEMTFVQGNYWEKLFSSHLSALTHLEFYIEICHDQPMNVVNLNVLLLPFENEYFLKRGWQFMLYYDSKVLCLHTLPYPESTFSTTLNRIQSTVGRAHGTHNEIVKHLHVYNIGKKRFYYPNVESLYVENSSYDHKFFFSVKKCLNYRKLKLLKLHESDDDVQMMDSTTLSKLLYTSRQLQTLDLSIVELIELTQQFTHVTLCKRLSQRIQHLILSDYYCTPNDVDLFVETFSKNLESLDISVNTLSDCCEILKTVLRRMRKLKNLYVTFGHDEKKIEFNFDTWLRENTSLSNFISDIDGKCLNLWLGDKGPVVKSSDFSEFSDSEDFF
ncbi:unnamed protein product [Didymodactylos carnosus]|uniref:Uncharacterized protein n=1 Tax=Didymodactylos carnosus TaxID=1234261 RepID=A0A8S2J132_9BILA|nr:unnamed protein product [Didymodactylos carnosus]CAF3777676.1 unnamed protein product [Didymodactylos carnosus]